MANLTKKEITDKIYDLANELESVCADIELSLGLHEQICNYFERSEIPDWEAVYTYKKVSVLASVQLDRLHNEHKQFSETVKRIYALMQEISA